MQGGDLETTPRAWGGDLQTLERQYGSGIWGFIKNIFGGAQAEELRKRMQDPEQGQKLTQRGGLGMGAMLGMSLLPMLLGRGQDGESIRRQMVAGREPMMQRGGLSIPPGLVAKALPILKTVGAPLAMGALASVGDNLVDKVFGRGRKGNSRKSSTRASKRRSQKRRSKLPPTNKFSRGQRARKRKGDGLKREVEGLGRQLFEHAKSRVQSGIKSGAKKRGRRRRSSNPPETITDRIRTRIENTHNPSFIPQSFNI